MSNRRAIGRNALASVMQAAIAGATLFLLYRYLLLEIGQARLGVWSLILAVTAVTRVSEFGFSAGAVHMVARYRAEGNGIEAAKALETAIVSSALAVAVIAILAGSAFRPFMPSLINGDLLPEAIAVLPLSMVSLWLGTVSASVFSGLDGCMRVDIRGYIGAAGNVVYLGMAMALASSRGLVGLAVAQCVQGALSAAVGWLFLRRELASLPVLPGRVDRRHLRSMLRYGVGFQAVSVANLLLEPTTKVLLARFGSLGQVAYFEMANRMIGQVRMLLVASFQAAVPVFAGLRGEDNVRAAYRASYRLMFYLALPMFALMAACVPLLAHVWIGGARHDFIWMAELVLLGWAANTLLVPAYMANLGTGELKWNTISHVVIGALNALLGGLFGIALGGGAVVLGWSLALVGGSAVLVAAFQRRYEMGWKELIPSESRLLACVSALVWTLGALWALGPSSTSHGLFGAVVSAVLAGALLAAPVWRNSNRRVLGQWRGPPEG